MISEDEDVSLFIYGLMILQHPTVLKKKYLNTEIKEEQT